MGRRRREGRLEEDGDVRVGEPSSSLVQVPQTHHEILVLDVVGPFLFN